MNNKKIDKKGIFRLIGFYALGIFGIATVFFNNFNKGKLEMKVAYEQMQSQLDSIQYERDSIVARMAKQETLLLDLWELGRTRASIDALKEKILYLELEDTPSAEREQAKLQRRIDDLNRQFNTKESLFYELEKDTLVSVSLYILEELIKSNYEIIEDQRKKLEYSQLDDGEVLDRLNDLEGNSQSEIAKLKAELKVAKAEAKSCDASLQNCQTIVRQGNKVECNPLACQGIKDFVMWMNTFKSMKGKNLSSIKFKYRGLSNDVHMKGKFKEELEKLVNTLDREDRIAVEF